MNIETEACYLESQVDYTDDVHYFRYFKDTSKPNKDGLYKCTLCKQYKPKSSYYKDKRNPCGIRSRCKKCYHMKGE